MEDILASIRRILNEDEAGTPVPAASGAPAEPEPFVLTEEMIVELPPSRTGPSAERDASRETGETSSAPEPTDVPETLAAEPVTLPPPTPEADPMSQPSEAVAQSTAVELLTPTAAAAAAASVGSLLRAVAAERNAAVSRSGPTIEDLVREELRPLLREWLEQHLPPLVERLVRAEIERVVGRALS